MEKQKAIELLGGTVSAAAEAIGITYQAVADWPEMLSTRISDRVYAALTRKQQARKPKRTPKPTPQSQAA